jgi:regulatory protein
MDEYKKHLDKALRFLSYRARSEKEILDFLHKKQTPEEITEKIVTFLKERKFVNDKQFAASWIESRLRAKPKSIRVLKLELKNKGISEEVATQAISNFQFPISNEGSNQGVSDLETAKRLVEKRIARYKGLSKQEVYQKLGGFLARRGFDWDTIKRSIDDVFNLEYNE